MSDGVVETFARLQSQPAGFQQVGDGPGAYHRRSQIVATFTETANNIPEERAFDARYDAAVAEVRRAWGEPEYEGRGRREGYEGPCPAADDYFFQLFSKALRIAWWRREEFIDAIIVTGHDANAFRQLQLTVADADVALVRESP